jgi:hypothetical protein
LDDLAVQRMTVVLIPLADVNAHENALAFEAVHYITTQL